MIDENRFAIYKRRDDGHYSMKNSIMLDNRYIILYNLSLLVRYQTYINIEWCNKSKIIKYLFKYINKDIDRTRAVIIKNVITNVDIGEQ